MKLVLIGFVALLLLLAGSTFSDQPGRGDVVHGEYLSRHVGMCIQCHSPRDENGDLLLSQLFAGAPVPVSAPRHDTPWAEFAPRIAGLLQYSDQQALTLLTQGISRTGKPLRPPMPPFRFSPQDARDIIAYLRSLQ